MDALKATKMSVARTFSENPLVPESPVRILFNQDYFCIVGIYVIQKEQVQQMLRATAVPSAEWAHKWKMYS
jgi:hypothetical protein